MGECWPELTVIFDVDEMTAARRLAGAPKSRRAAAPAEHSLFSDRLERKGAEFQRLVRQGFLAQASDQPGKYLVVDGGGDVDAVFALLLRGLQERLG